MAVHGGEMDHGEDARRGKGDEDEDADVALVRRAPFVTGGGRSMLALAWGVGQWAPVRNAI